MALYDVMSKLKAILRVSTQKEEGMVDIKIESFERESKTDADPDYKNRCVLVGVVRNTYQFEVLLREKFYHIPISFQSYRLPSQDSLRNQFRGLCGAAQQPSPL